MNQKLNNPPLQDPILNSLRIEKKPVTVILKSGVKLAGQIQSFDAFVVVLQDNKKQSMIYKHAISTVLPGAPLTPIMEKAKEKREKDNKG